MTEFDQMVIYGEDADAVGSIAGKIALNLCDVIGVADRKLSNGKATKLMLRSGNDVYVHQSYSNVLASCIKAASK